ncbi:MAG: type II toxin-antitoxin system VapC family toxin [Actinomycetes bacterium]
MNLPDVNVLVGALRPDAPAHERCRAWLEATVRDPRPFAVTSSVLSGVVRVLTHPRVFQPPSHTSAVLAELDRLRSQPTAVPVEPGPRHWELLRSLCEGAEARGNLVPDAALAAVAIEHGCTLVTLDRDFARFEGLAWGPPDRPG